MDAGKAKAWIERYWGGEILPALREYVAIPSLSPAFDRQWREHGHMDRAVDLIAGWIRAQAVPGLTLDVVRIGDRTPLLVVEVPGEGIGTVLIYGHLDKQPPMDGWREGLGPWTPVVRGGRLYGRGAGDDGYAAFAAIAAIKALAAQGRPYGRCVMLIEACEESGSYDLTYYLDALRARIGTPSLVVCLDSGCGDFERLWVTTSLRGLANGVLSVSTLTEGVHSGGASGIVPSSFRIVRQLLSRLEDENTGGIRPRELYVNVPEERLRQIAETALVLGDRVYREYPFQPAADPVARDVAELLLNRTWRPQLEITGAAGIPAIEQAGNVLRPQTAVNVSLRLPPTADAEAAVAFLRGLFEHDPPYRGRVSFAPTQVAPGWDAPAFAPWLEKSIRSASEDFFGRPACCMGEGGTIPFMSLLGRKFPAAQFLVTGVLGPGSNAHGPNEFLDLATAARLTGCIARVLHDQARAA